MVLVTVTLVSVMLPQLLTVPEMASVPPGGTGLAGQFFVTAMQGVLVPGQLAVAWAVTMRPSHLSTPRAFTVSFFFNEAATTEIYPLSLHDALPISSVATLRT